MFRFVLIPLFLFSGTFFPVTQLPGWLQPVAYATPLWHGVALCRGISLGTLTAGTAALHAGYLAAVTAAGLAAGRVTYRRRLHA
jgi:lipooligosaccharide transport system permease protein